jgi:hypothetical protein
VVVPIVKSGPVGEASSPCCPSEHARRARRPVDASGNSATARSAPPSGIGSAASEHDTKAGSAALSGPCPQAGSAWLLHARSSLAKRGPRDLRWRPPARTANRSGGRAKRTTRPTDPSTERPRIAGVNSALRAGSALKRVGGEPSTEDNQRPSEPGGQLDKKHPRGHDRRRKHISARPTEQGTLRVTSA